VTLACPVCCAVNDAGPACRRCRADLSLCVAVEERRDRELAAARSAAAAGDIGEALAHAERAATLRRGPDADRLRAVLHLLGGNFSAAWRCYRAAASA
jgi:Flp pilus assembly protein TadD